MHDDTISPFQIHIPDAAIEDLHRRLDAVRWPERETVKDWSQGVPLAVMQSLMHHWRHNHDWRPCEAWLNSAGQSRTRIDGIDIHFLHIRSRHENAMPLLLSHGWPGSVLEFRKVATMLVDPEAHGGQAEDAFHLVIPSLPGFGYSEKPKEAGWGVKRIASAWHTLMQRLGYQRYVAQGGDWGAAVTTELGLLKPEGLQAIHVNMPIVLPEDPAAFAAMSPEEARMVADLEEYKRWDGGYSDLQSTRPQTVGYALTDSPVGQAAWIYEKFWSWMDCGDTPESAVSRDEMLDIISLYWFTGTAASSARLYWESFHGAFFARQLDLPVGCSVFPQEIYKAARSWADRCMPQLIHWNELPRGGHFAAFEQPELFTEEVRTCFAKVRS